MTSGLRTWRARLPVFLLVAVAVFAGRLVSAKAAVAAQATEATPVQANWPRFRGWDGSGHSQTSNSPISWDTNTGSGIAWRTAIPAPGHSSPVVWDNRLFITAATTSQRDVIAFDAANGKLLWNHAVEVPGSPAALPDIPEDNGFASPTPATDGRNVYALFANGDLAALAFDGSVAWSKYLGPLRNAYGHATSLAIWQDRLLVQLDQGSDIDTNSRLMCFEASTGRELWRRSRAVSASWATPVVADVAGKTQIITVGVPWLTAYTPADGAELWRANVLDGEMVPSPIVAGGLVLAMCPSSLLVAVHPDGAGDVSKTKVAWTNDENVPDIPSAVSAGDLVFTVTGGGQMTCFELAGGHKVWEHDLGLEVQASPSVVGNQLFVLGLNGEGVVLEAGRAFKELRRSKLPDKFRASPAFAGGRTYLRGETNLYCIGPAADSATKSP